MICRIYTGFSEGETSKIIIIIRLKNEKGGIVSINYDLWSVDTRFDSSILAEKRGMCMISIASCGPTGKRRLTAWGSHRDKKESRPRGFFGFLDFFGFFFSKYA